MFNVYNKLGSILFKGDGTKIGTMT